MFILQFLVFCALFAAFALTVNWILGWSNNSEELNK